MNSISALTIVMFIFILGLAGIERNKQSETGADNLKRVFLYNDKSDSLVVLKYNMGLVKGVNP